jgi:hypothetical protein
MKFPTTYKCLNQNVFTQESFKIVPLRYKDRNKIMKWRNEQMYHLRQTELLNTETQKDYFKNTVAPLFDEEKPNQILFSFLKKGECIGYGGLVHMNWIDRHAEISFIMNTELEAIEFDLNWTRFLNQIEIVAFTVLKLHKLFVYAFDIRPQLYLMLKKKNYFLDAVLKEHCFLNDKYIDVVIHSKISDL